MGRTILIVDDEKNIVDILGFNLKKEGYDVVYTSIIPDDQEKIKAELIACADEKGISLVITTAV